MKRTIRDIAQIQTGYFARPTTSPDVIYLQSRHFDEFGQIVTMPEPELGSDKISERHFLKNGDVLFAAKGSKNFATVFEELVHKAVASTTFFVLRLRTQKVLPGYLAWYLNNSAVLQRLQSQARGTSMLSIGKNDLDDMEVYIPELAKQNIIIKINQLSIKEHQLRMSLLQKRTTLLNNTLLNSIT